MFKFQDSVIFDGDDTLWQNQIYYDEAKQEFFNLLSSLGFQLDYVITTFANIDVANVKTFGFSKERFPQSMVDTYKSLSKLADKSVDPIIVSNISEIGKSVFNRKPALLDGALELIQKLNNSFNIVLFTAGDEEVQWEKIHSLNIQKFFNYIKVVPKKNVFELKALVEGLNLSISKSWMIGNSLRSDINPAVQLGMRSIWLHSNSWEYDVEDNLPGNVWEVNTLKEVYPVLTSVIHIPNPHSRFLTNT